MKPEIELTHQDLLDILKELDESEIEVTDWEARFIESNLDARTFSRKQKEIITKMWRKYEADCH